MSRIAALALLSMLAACRGDPAGELEKAREHLAGGDYAGAVAAASRGLTVGAEGSIAWRLELVALEGEARGGKTEDVLARLDRLAGAWPAQVTGPLYVQTAGQLKETGDAAGAVRVLDAGARRFPEDADITRAIAQAKAAGTAEELEALRSLGYVE